MRILVQIGEDEQTFDFNSTEISVGALNDCDIFLAYEGVGDQHLKIVQKADQFFVVDLNSGFPTFMNDKKLVAGKPYVFNTFFPLELGGIVISLVDEVPQVTESPDLIEETLPDIPPDAPVVSPSTGKPLEKEVVEQINKKFEQEHASEREKYKPDLYKGSKKNTREFKISRETTQSRRVKLAKKKGAKAAHTRKRIKKDRKKVNVNSNFQRFSLSTIAIVGVMLFISAYILYKKHYSKIISGAKKPVVTTLKTDYRVIDSGIAVVDGMLPRLKKVFNLGGGCQVNEDFCRFFGPIEGWQDYEGMVLDNDSLFIFFTKEKISSFAPLLSYIPGDEAGVDEYVGDNYAEIFSLEEFQNNGRKAPVTSYQFPKDDYQSHMLFFSKLLDPTVQASLEIIAPKSIYFFTISSEAKSINIYNFAKLPLASSVFNSTRYGEIMFEFKVSYNSFLTQNLQNYMREIAQTSFNEFDSKKSDDFFNQKRMQEFYGLLELPICNNDFINLLCQDVATVPTGGQHRVAENGETLVVIVNTDDIMNQNRAIYPEDYTDEEIKSLMALYRAVNRKRGYQYKQFKWDGYKDNRIEYRELQSNSVVATMISTTLFDQFLGSEQYKELVVLGEESGGLHTVMTFDRATVEKINVEKYRPDTKYFWKSHLPVFEKFIRQYPTSFIKI